ncbi:autotransporter domain-containing protein [Chlamydia vaughanii]|uniref:autotransporter domain-containing protein n=1 Tax=Chlamydia vaughanii TaxID=3112552 RepID=UPI0032B13165
MKLFSQKFALLYFIFSTAHTALANPSQASTQPNPTQPTFLPLEPGSKRIEIKAPTDDLTQGVDGLTETMTTKETSKAGGTSYQLSAGDITFKNISEVIPSTGTPPQPQPPATAVGNCFVNTAGDLSFQGNQHSLIFENISLTGQGAAIRQVANNDESLSFFRLDKLLFSGCPENAVTEGQGAIYCEGSGVRISNNNSAIFTNNFSKTNGGAITSILKEGAALPHPNDFLVLVQSTQYTEFSGNSAGQNGGAIYTQGLRLTAHGNIKLTNNRAGGKGGAVYIAPDGIVNLLAISGDLLFEGNISSQGNNAMHLGTGAKITEITIKQGHSITFNDPITGDQANSTEKLTINATGYTGTLIFSGNPGMNNVSQLTQPIELAAGTLVIKNGAVLTTKSFTQTNSSSKVLLEINPDDSSSATSLLSSESIDLKNVHVDLTNFSNQRYVNIGTTGNQGNITISGPIVLENANPDFYKNPLLDNPLSADVVQLTTQGTITLTDPLPSFPDGDLIHYGHQGTWETSLINVAFSGGGSSKKIDLSWQPTGYIPFPNEKPQTTSLIPNNLWSLATDVQAIHKLIENSLSEENTKDIWVRGVVNSLHRRASKNEQKFRHASGGYAVGISSQTSGNFNFSLGFVELFGTSKDCDKAAIHEKVFAGSLCAKYEGDLLTRGDLLGIPTTTDLPFILQGQFGYVYEDNSLKIDYSNKNNALAFKKAKGSWKNHGYFADTGVFLSFPMFSKTPLFQEILPFVRMQNIRLSQKAFEETGYNRRNFASTHLTNLSLSPGIKIQGYASSLDSYCEICIAYVGDVYRHNPQNTTTFVAPAQLPVAPFITKATNLHRHAGKIQGSGNFPINSYMQLSVQGEVEIRKSSTNYYATLGSAIPF